MHKNFFTVSYSIITNSNAYPVGKGMSRSLAKATALASGKAWDLYAHSNATNWADVWVRVYKGGKLIACGFEGSLEPIQSWLGR